MLALDCFGPTAFADLLFFIAHLRNQVGQEAHVGFKARRSGVYMRLKNRGTRRRSGIDAFVHELNVKEVTVKQRGGTAQTPAVNGPPIEGVSLSGPKAAKD